MFVGHLLRAVSQAGGWTHGAVGTRSARCSLQEPQLETLSVSLGKGVRRWGWCPEESSSTWLVWHLCRAWGPAPRSMGHGAQPPWGVAVGVGRSQGQREHIARGGTPGGKVRWGWGTPDQKRAGGGGLREGGGRPTPAGARGSEGRRDLMRLILLSGRPGAWGEAKGR